MRIINSIKQGTEDWLRFKAGKFSGSEIYKLMGAKGLGEIGLTYIKKKVGEELTGNIQQVTSYAMERGKELEEIAVAFYEGLTKIELSFAGCFISDFSNDVIYSPDCYYNNILLEIKCPLQYENHVEYLMIKNSQDLKESKKEYYWQIQLGLMVSGFYKAEFISFHPDFPDNLKIISIEIKRNESDIILLKERILQAIEVKETYLKQINL